MPGDEVLVVGSLPPNARLGRLFVFAREGEAEFSPYVYHAADKMRIGIDGPPQIMHPMTMRLTEQHSLKQLDFIVDIDGYLTVMQEVDRADDPRARIKLKRKICPYLPWTKKIARMLTW